MKQRIILLILIFKIFSACNTLKPINSEYNLVRTFSEPKIYEYGNGKILIYNGAGFFHKTDDTATLNIWIDGKALGQLKYNEFLVIYLMPGTYQFRVQHNDIINFESTHTVIIDKNTSVIKVMPKASSNKVEIVNEIELTFFKKYKNVLK